MNLQRKIYETRGEKVKDFIIGFLVFIGVNVVFGLISWGILAATGSLGSSDPTGIINTAGPVVSLVTSVLPLLLNVGLMIYFGLTRIWILWGMLGAFAAGLLLTLCLVAACFAAVFGMLGTSGG
jgi:hypothetical protein